MQGYEIRPLRSLAELKAVEHLQRAAWDDPATVIYQHMLVSLTRNGGSVIGALHNGEVVGAVISFIGVEDTESDRPAMANLKLVSQRMAVHPEHRNAGVGYELKLAQRQYAIRQGLRLITWTFDPLISRNAHLNIRKLGAIAQGYYRDYYGTDDSPLVKAESSDRLFVEWWVTSNRVEQRINGRRGALSLRQYLDGNANILNPAILGDSGLPRPSESVGAPQSTLALLEIPTDFDAIVAADLPLAIAWRQHTRESLENMVAGGYAVTDFLYGEHEGRPRSFYVLSYAEYSDIRITRFSNN